MAKESTQAGPLNAKQRLLAGPLLLLLLLAVVVSALMVAYLAQQSRHRFTTLENLLKQQYELDAQWTQLMLEKGTLLSLSQVEQVARKRLSMRKPASDEVVVVRE